MPTPAVMRLMGKQQEGPIRHSAPGAQTVHDSAARPHPSDHHPSLQSPALHLAPASNVIPPGAPLLPYPQLPSSFSSPAPPATHTGSKSRSVDLSAQSAHFSLASASRPSAHLLSKASISNPIIKPASIPQDPIAPPFLANRTASDTLPLSHLTYLPVNYAQKFKSAPKLTALEFIKSDRRHSPSYNPMKPSGHDTSKASSGDVLHWDGRGLQPADTILVDPAQTHKTPPLRPSAVASQLPTTQTTAEKSTMSFFKRPIRMMREKKGPPAPLMVIGDPLSIKPIEIIKPPPPSPPLIRPSKVPNSRTHSDTSKPSTDPTSVPLTQKAPSSSSTGSKLNSLLNAAARSIRTGDSRLLETFTAALSPRFVPESDKMPPPIQPWSRKPQAYAANSLKRIPVPAYHTSETDSQSPISPRLTRTTSYERPKTATKHSRTSSMPFSQAPPALQHANPLQGPHIPSQEQIEDQIETVEKLPEAEEVKQSAYIPADSTVNIQIHPTLVLEDDSEPLGITSPSPLEPDPSGRKQELYVTGARAHRSSSNLSYDDFREMVSRAMGSPLTVNHTISHRNSCLSQKSSALSHSPLRHVNDVAHERVPARDSLAELVTNANKSAPGFLQRASSCSIQEAKRESFQNMPLPALPTLLSSRESDSNSSPGLNVEGAKPTATLENIKKQPRPWTMAIPGSFDHRQDLQKLLPDLAPSLRKKTLVQGTTLQHALTLTASNPKSSFPKRKIRHSYPLRLVSSGSPLERVSNALCFPDSPGQTGKPLHFKLRTSGEFEYRHNATSRLTPSLTSPCPNLMFGFRGEVYEVDKCEKPLDNRQSVKSSFDYDQDSAVKSSLDYQSPDPTLPPGFVDEKQTSTSVGQDIAAQSPTIEAFPGRGATAVDKAINDQNATDMLPRIDMEPDELGQSIELKEICLIGGGNADDAKENLRASGYFAQEILIEPPSPRLSERNVSTEHLMENLSMDRGSSEEESFRLPDESHNFELGSEPKIINPETSLEMAASILGQPVPAVSKQIWKGFERLHSLTEGRFMESEGKDLREVLGRLFEPGSQSGNTTTEVAVQTDPVAFAQRNDHFVLQPPCIIRRSSTRRVADALKKLAQRREQTESLSKENLPLNLTRHSFQSERSFVSASRGSVSSLQECMKSSQHDTPRTSGSTRTPWSERRPAGLAELAELRRFSSTRSRTPHSIHLSHFSPLRQATGESHLSLRSHSSPLTTSPLLTESVLDALDNALRAEETFQREKQHLQSVARRQSQTIESLLLDKEVLSLEVARLTGLVELLTRDHNLLNERIDKAEEAFDKIPSSKAQASRSHSPDETACYSTAATGEGILHKAEKLNLAHKQRQDTEKEERSFKSNGILTETDDGVMAGDSEDSEDNIEDDRDSLCDPEQGSMIQHVLCTSPRSPFGLLNSHKNQSPIPGSYPLLPTVPAV
ncbi:hypothetical protein PTTG_00045 [Puccinia triticina 1-1 BBBD Race 1]|uniref:Uncharacterized protein n=2 Tax=Puccinia triticina TaxID=208348 RepID=A0A0C4EH29_PUCT1|nr:uncharacterized protein PtA15_4A61 [Puccinia triticina]OAV90729.1 hypothetical protein PTTG_00045 [Puccinia triticina 1-1 BBBD Race 1]WAQ83613.1 hypothetical protein PtA15_4A61 [Puccinia triticina]